MDILEPFLLGIVIGVVLNGVLLYRARRQRQLAEVRLNLIDVVSRFEEKLLHGTVRDGDLCHDLVFQTMTRVQNHQIYPSVHRQLFSKTSPKEQEFHMRLNKELKADGELAVLIRHFIQYYHRAYRLEKPFGSGMVVVWLSLRHLSVRLFLTALLGILCSAIGVRELVKGYREWKDKVDEWLLTKTIAPSLPQVEPEAVAA